MNSDTPYDDTASTLVLENIKNKLIHAFRGSAEQVSTTCDSGHPASLVTKDLRANEELRRAKIDGAITWLRSELLEMRSQDRQLAKTLLDINTEIQRLRRESEAAAPDRNFNGTPALQNTGPKKETL